LRAWLAPLWVVLFVLCGRASAQPDIRARDAGFIGKDVATLEIDACETPDGTPESLRARGSEYYQRGDVLYSQGDYAGAVKEFVSAYCIGRFYSLLKDIGQAYERELNYELAIAYFERYVMAMPKDDPQGDYKNINARIKVLQELRAKILITTEPGDAQIVLSNEVGKQNRGTSGQEIAVLGGHYDVLIEKKGYNSVVQQIDVKIGKPYAVFVRLDPKKGKLRVRTIPSNARLFLDQKQAGIGAFETELQGGRYTVAAEAPDFVSTTREIEVIADRDTPITIELQPQPQTGRRQFIGYATVAGGIAGGTLAGASSEPAVIGVGITVGLGAGFFGSYFVTPRDIPLGTSSLTITSSLVGGTLFGASTVLFTGNPNRIAPAIGSGLVLGGMAGYYLGEKSSISPGDAAVINSGALWGTVVGSLFTTSFDAQEDRRIGASIVLTGLSMGTLGGVLMTRYFDVSRTRAALIDLGGVVGVFVGAAIDNVVSQSTEMSNMNSERTANYTLGGLVTGLILGGVLTRNIDTPTVPVSPVVSTTQSTGPKTSATPTFGVGGSF